MATSGRRTIWVLAAVSALPLVAAGVLYQFWRPDGGMNHGELLETRPLAPTRLVDPDGHTFTSEKLLGKWLLVTIQPPECDAKCQRKLYYLRQIRVAQGENMDRVARLWLLRGAGTPDQGVVAGHPGLIIATPVDPGWLATFPVKGEVVDHIFLLDPLGNLVLRYDDDVNPEGMIRDLTRLLKISRLG